MAKINMEIYVPFLGCACRPGMKIDSNLEKLQQTLIKLKEKYKNDIAYLIYSLNLHLNRFREHKELVYILQNEGDSGLPAIFINGQMVFHGHYPDYEELETAIERFNN
jgi:glutaredoxin